MYSFLFKIVLIRIYVCTYVGYPELFQLVLPTNLELIEYLMVNKDLITFHVTHYSNK